MDVPAAQVAAVLVAPVDLAAPAVPVAAVPVVLEARVGPVALAARRDPTTAALPLPRPARCGWRPPRGAGLRG